MKLGDDTDLGRFSQKLPRSVISPILGIRAHGTKLGEITRLGCMPRTPPILVISPRPVTRGSARDTELGEITVLGHLRPKSPILVISPRWVTRRRRSSP